MHVQEIVNEANLVFKFNIGIFEELEGSPFKADVDTDGDQ